MSASARRIVLIAGEPSGDVLGARMMAALRRAAGGTLSLEGIGGEQMIAAGLESRFPMSELSHMGFLELLPHLPNLRRRIDETAAWLRAAPPDLLVTIDAPGFCLRVAKRLRDLDLPILHYVAPTVWAWKPGRAAKLARLCDHLLALLPFEPPYFTTHGLPCTYVGHPALETMAGPLDGDGFRRRHGIPAGAPALCLLPGSRAFELRQLMPVFVRAVRQLARRRPDLHIILPTVQPVAALAERSARNLGLPTVLVLDPKEKGDAFAAGDLALAASGTVAVELAVAGTPAVIAYRGNPLSAEIVRRLVKVKYASLINLMLDRMAAPELLQENCRAERIVAALDGLLADPAARQAQRAAYAEAMAKLAVDGRPSDRAAAVALSMVGEGRAAARRAPP